MQELPRVMKCSRCHRTGPTVIPVACCCIQKFQTVFQLSGRLLNLASQVGLALTGLACLSQLRTCSNLDVASGRPLLSLHNGISVDYFSKFGRRCGRQLPEQACILEERTRCPAFPPLTLTARRWSALSTTPGPGDPLCRCSQHLSALSNCVYSLEFGI